MAYFSNFQAIKSIFYFLIPHTLAICFYIGSLLLGTPFPIDMHSFTKIHSGPTPNLPLTSLKDYEKYDPQKTKIFVSTAQLPLLRDDFLPLYLPTPSIMPLGKLTRLHLFTWQ